MSLLPYLERVVEGESLSPADALAAMQTILTGQGIGNNYWDILPFGGLDAYATIQYYDAVRVLAANGPAGGNLADVKRRDTIVAGVDQVAVDAFGATLLGLRPADIGYVVEGHARGLGNMNYAALSPARVEV